MECLDCGETFFEFETEFPEDADHFVPGYPLTWRGRIERAVAGVCEAAAQIRRKLEGKPPELPF